MSNKPELVPLDVDYIRRIAKTVHNTFQPQIEFAKDQRREAIAQVTAFILLTEIRMDDLGLKSDQRAAVVKGALRILAQARTEMKRAEKMLAAPFVENAASTPTPSAPGEVIPLRPTVEKILEQFGDDAPLERNDPEPEGPKSA